MDVRQDEADRIANQIDVFSKAFMGMTVACARCHEHQFDAISTEDYYALSGVLKSTRQQTAFLGELMEGRTVVREALDSKNDVSDSFRRHIKALTENDAGLDTWIEAAREVLGGEWKEGDGPEAYRADRRFASFETEDLPEWEEGVSHFTRVHSGSHEEPSKAYREASALRRTALGRRSLDTRGRQGVPDLPDAELWTKPFVVTHNYIEFLLNGGIVTSNVSVNLVIDGDRVHNETSPGSGEFVRVVWDVAEYKGREAQFLVLDTEFNVSNDDDGHYITVDNIVFSDSRELYEIRRPIAAVAKETGLEAEALEDWLDVVAKRLPYLTSGANAPQNEEEWHRFSGEDFGDWTTTGSAFGDGPVQRSDVMVTGGDVLAVPRGVAHSGLATAQSRGVLRSPTFTLNHDAIHYRALGKSAQVRLIIDENRMVKYVFRLFEDTILDVDTRGTYGWITQYKQIGKYRGHRVYLELADEGDGYLSVDSIVFSNSHLPPSDSDLAPDKNSCGRRSRGTLWGGPRGGFRYRAAECVQRVGIVPY